MTLIYWNDASLNHVTPPGHPERVARVEAIKPALEALDGLEWRDAPKGTREDVFRCHPGAYFDRVEAAVPEQGYVSLDGDTHMMSGSLDAALHAVGGCGAAVDAVLAGDSKTAFVAMRPPGHHAETQTAMGFCLFGTAAIAAKRALDHHGLSRVAVLDFDVHHGNGTQDLLWNEERTLFGSSHQMPLYPGSGYPSERGAANNIMNVPLASNSGSAQMREAYETLVFPRLQEFAPKLFIISAGFDAHHRDPLANIELTADDFDWATGKLMEIAANRCENRVVSMLEGGYDLQGLAESSAAHVRRLMTG